MTAATLSAPRAQSIVQRAYVYIVALVAIHMVVLGVANILRVLAELALGAPSGGFTGLPFAFADVSRARTDVYREQASLAIALLAVGTPAWWIHFRMAERAADLVAERSSALRSLYVHVVVFVTALLVFGYGQRALRLVLQGVTFGEPGIGPTYGLEPEWQARAAGAAAMVVAAAIALVFHLRLSAADRSAVPIAGRAAGIRHLALYALVVVGLVTAASNAGGLLDQVWQRVADALVPLPGRVPVPPPGVPPPPIPSRDDFLRFQLLGQIPAVVAGLALWLATWIPLQRGLTHARDAAVERESIIRKLAIYLIVFVSAVAVLFGTTATLSVVVQRILGDPVIGTYTSLWHDLGSPVIFVVVFAPMWIFHRRVVESEAAREVEAVRAATLRRLYTYLVMAIALAMTAIGVAGTLGVLGSALLGLNTHANAETAIYVSLVVVGAAAWALHWRTARARLNDDERRSLPRRLYLYLAILGGVLGLLVFGSAALYRVLNAALGLSFERATWHDVWHFVVDSAVAGVVAYWNVRLLRADRAVLGASGEETYAVTVLVRAADRDAAKARVTEAIAGSSDITLKG
ncbi:MAG TPA: DUF5671 domain-containing protein [Candidatus Limnocylindria bacterium]